MSAQAHRINEPDDGSWLRTLKADVQPMTFKKGRQYAEGRRVALMARAGDVVSAKVTGSNGERYDVQLSPGADGKIVSACSCESFNKYGPHCKHVVAVGLVYLTRVRSGAAEAAVAVASAGHGATSDDAEPGAAPPSPAGPGPEADDDSDDTGPAGGLPRLTAAEEVTLPALAKLESWLGLSALPDFEFLYRLTPVSGPHGRHWVLDVRRVDASAKGPVNVKRALAAGTRVAPADELVFQALSASEMRHDSRLVLLDAELANLLDLLEKRRVVYRGTALQFDERPARPVVRLEQKPEGGSARLDVQLPDGATLLLKDVLVISGRRSWVIAGQHALRLEPDFPPRLLRKWLLEPQTHFPVSQLDRVLSFFAAHLPRFRLSLVAEGLKVEEGVEPRFLLTLEGSAEQVRAKLAARYGPAVTVPVSPNEKHLGYASGGGGEGDRKLYLRQEVAERAAAKALIDRGFRYEPGGSSYEAKADAALEFWAKGHKELPKAWELFAAQPPKVRVRARVRPRVRVNMSAVNWFELDADFTTEDQSVDLGAVRMWLDSGRRYVPLKDGTWAEADPTELKAAADLLEEAGALPGKKTTRLPLFHAPALDLLAELGEVEIDAKAKKAIAELKEVDGIPPVKPPEALKATLRHYQEAGLAWLWFLHKHGLSGVLADDMGLGKTVQALAVVLKAKTDLGPSPVLVVAPTSVLPNWEREIERFTPSLSYLTWHGADRKDSIEQLGKTDLILTSFALVRRDLETLKAVKYRTVILDEAQNIKNADSVTAQACKSFDSETRLALTGTPLENRLSELWSQFDFLMPGFLGSADGFHDRFEHPIAVQGDISVRDRLKRRIHPFVLRRMKGEVAKDLPPKTEMVAWCEMDPGQAALYKEVLDDSRRKVFDQIEKVGFNRSRVSILAALMKLRQVCCDPRLLKLPPGTMLPPSAKLLRFAELTEDLISEGHRALVFSQFTEMLTLLKEQAEQKGHSFLYLDGRTKDRMTKVDAFNAEGGPPIFFISLKAGGTGLNLTAADYVIHYDPWWNPAVEDQATDRTHRIGQTKAVFAYKLITKNTVEEKILELQKRKRELAAGVLGSDTEVGKSLTEEDVEDLFKQE